MTTIVTERDINGQTRRLYVEGTNVKILQSQVSEKGSYDVTGGLLKRIFLPAGYPDSVSPDYLRYQVLNALQAFCNSLASLLSSRAVLQGFGVGDPEATPTKALLLTVLQDAFGRLTTICSAHLLGTSLYPEARLYRLLADMFNEVALILDTFSPFFNSLPIPGLRISALCLSAALKSLCGICAGGSKAAITMHFATPAGGKGDVGDLNAKDASKETVLALCGMLLGTLVIPYLDSSRATYTLLFLLVGLHFIINYFGVRGLALRSLNQQRLAILWLSYQKSSGSQVHNPSDSSKVERVFQYSGIIRDPDSNVILGRGAIGSSISRLYHVSLPPGLIDLFQSERYLLFLEEDVQPRSFQNVPRVHIFLKDGYTDEDLLKAWIHTIEVCLIFGSRTAPQASLSALDLVKSAYQTITARRDDFVTKLQKAGWNIDECALMTSPPAAIIMDITPDEEDRKRR